MHSEPSGRRLDRLTVFCHLWAIAGLTESARWLWDGTAWSWLLLPAALALFAFPRSLTCLVTWAIVQSSFHALSPHTPWNHGSFIALMNVAILASVARVYVRGGRGVDQLAREAIVEQFAPTLRISLILLYAFAFLHKLNWDYLDPRFSCADQVLTWLNTKYRILPTGDELTTVGIWSSLFVESVVPILLCSRYTARFGLIIGFTFHLALSQFGGLYGFAAAMYAIYYLFLPVGFTEDVGARLDSIRQRLALNPVRAWIGPVLAAAILTSGLLLHVLRGTSALGAGLWWWNLWILGVVACFALELVRALRKTEAATLSPRWLPLVVVPLLVIYNGFCPYLGLKTESSWGMYSNLRTEIRSNHIFMPPWLQVAGYQQDLVEVVATSLPELQRYQREGLLLNFLEFRRISSAATRDFTVTYERGGVVRHLQTANGVSNDASVTTSAGWLTDMLLIFRPIDAQGPMQCRH
jgi:hypothetical protein